MVKTTDGCATCGKTLKGRQQKYCGRNSKNNDSNKRNQDYVNQQARGLRRKLALVIERGGRCEQCGCRKNYAALAWHDLDPSQKPFEPDLRAMSNRSELAQYTGAAKCRLLGANCDPEIRHPDRRL